MLGGLLGFGLVLGFKVVIGRLPGLVAAAVSG